MARTEPAKTKRMQRVTIVGSGGSGKSTLADELGRRLNLPVVHLDRLYWKPGWVGTPVEEWRNVQNDLVSEDRWILDGNYSKTLDIRVAHADTVIILALSRWRCLARVLRRSLTNWHRDIQAAGCPEQLSLEFLRWVWNFPVRSRPNVDRALANHRNGLQVIELMSPSQVAEFLNQF
jgi:adenylate kinase family enzyme